MDVDTLTLTEEYKEQIGYKTENPHSIEVWKARPFIPRGHCRRYFAPQIEKLFDLVIEEGQDY